MIAYHRLHDRQAKSGAVLLGCVVRSEQAAAFFLSQAGTGIGDRNFNPIAYSVGANRQLSTMRHGVDRVEDEVLQGAMEQIRIG